MTPANDLLQLLSASCPGPWSRPIPDNHVGRIISPHAPECPPKAREIEAHDRWHRCIAIARNDQIADCIITLRNHLDALTDGSITPEAWDAVRHAVRGAIAPGAGCNDTLKLELTRVIEGPDSHGGFQIGAPAEVEGQPLQRRTIIEVRRADGGDAEGTAKLIAAMLSKAVGLLSTAMARTVAVRQIGQTTVVLDASFANEFDACDWQDDGGQIIERKTKMALGDVIMNTDGLWLHTPPQRTDGFLLPKAAMDYRRHKLMVTNRARPVEINIPPEVLVRLQAAAAEFNGDLGRAVSSRFA